MQKLVNFSEHRSVDLYKKAVTLLSSSLLRGTPTQFLEEWWLSFLSYHCSPPTLGLFCQFCIFSFLLHKYYHPILQTHFNCLPSSYSSFLQKFLTHLSSLNFCTNSFASCYFVSFVWCSCTINCLMQLNNSNCDRRLFSFLTQQAKTTKKIYNFQLDPPIIVQKQILNIESLKQSDLWRD